jgi:hypothetical protein
MLRFGQKINRPFSKSGLIIPGYVKEDASRRAVVVYEFTEGYSRPVVF